MKRVDGFLSSDHLYGTTRDRPRQSPSTRQTSQVAGAVFSSTAGTSAMHSAMPIRSSAMKDALSPDHFKNKISYLVEIRKMYDESVMEELIKDAEDKFISKKYDLVRAAENALLILELDKVQEDAYYSSLISPVDFRTILIKTLDFNNQPYRFKKIQAYCESCIRGIKIVDDSYPFEKECMKSYKSIIEKCNRHISKLQTMVSQQLVNYAFKRPVNWQEFDEYNKHDYVNELREEVRNISCRLLSSYKSKLTNPEIYSSRIIPEIHEKAHPKYSESFLSNFPTIVRDSTASTSQARSTAGSSSSRTRSTASSSNTSRMRRATPVESLLERSIKELGIEYTGLNKSKQLEDFNRKYKKWQLKNHPDHNPNTNTDRWTNAQTLAEQIRASLS